VFHPGIYPGRVTFPAHIHGFVESAAVALLPQKPVSKGYRSEFNVKANDLPETGNIPESLMM